MRKDKRGDLAYAIAKLNLAAATAPTNADIFVNLGNAYRKSRDGGQAATNYMKAAQVNASSGLPYYRLAMLYKTQRNWDIVAQNLDKAIKADPRFAPAPRLKNKQNHVLSHDVFLLMYIPNHVP